MTLCSYCGQPRQVAHGFDLCAPAQAAKARIDGAIVDIKRIADKQAPREPMTSNQMKLRADRLRETATGIKLNGGKVSPEYQ
jgi:hypothetical protein